MEIIPAIDDSDNDRLHWLALRGAEGLLSPAESQELSGWLDRSEAARHIFAGYCQLLVALECEPCLSEAMVETALPENVVTMRFSFGAALPQRFSTGARRRAS